MANATINPGTTSWACPAAVKKVKVECYGGGGGGGTSSTTKSNGSGAGGGGGGYARLTSLASSGTYDCVVGALGTGGVGNGTAADGVNGGFTWFGTTSTCYAGGGGGGKKGVADASAVAGLAGDATYGDAIYDGGAGYLGASGAAGVGGGGGGTGGSASIGNSATSSTGATAVTGGYNGGNGGVGHAVGVAPTDAYGGGGGGGGHTNVAGTCWSGGNGKPGVIFITYLLLAVSPAFGDDYGTVIATTDAATVQVLGIKAPAAFGDDSGAAWADDVTKVAQGVAATPVNVGPFGDESGAVWSEGFTKRVLSRKFIDDVTAQSLGIEVPAPADDAGAVWNDAVSYQPFGFKPYSFTDDQGASWADDAVQQPFGLIPNLFGDDSGAVWSDLTSVQVLGIEVPAFGDDSGAVWADSAVVAEAHVFAFGDDSGTVWSDAAIVAKAGVFTLGDDSGAVWDDIVDKTVADVGGATPVNVTGTVDDLGAVLADANLVIAGRVALPGDDSGTVWNDAVSRQAFGFRDASFGDDSGAVWADLVDKTVADVGSATPVNVGPFGDDVGAVYSDDLVGIGGRVIPVSDDYGAEWNDDATKSIAYLGIFLFEYAFADNYEREWRPL